MSERMFLVSHFSRNFEDGILANVIEFDLKKLVPLSLKFFIHEKMFLE